MPINIDIQNIFIDEKKTDHIFSIATTLTNIFVIITTYIFKICIDFKKMLI